MGCTNSKSIYRTAGIEASKLQFDSLSLREKDIACLYEVFGKISGGMETINISSLLAYFGLEDNTYMKKALTFSDCQSGIFNFKDFVFAIWNFQTLSSSDIGTFDALRIVNLVFIFVYSGLLTVQLYGVNINGRISKDECSVLMQDLFGNSKAPSKLVKRYLSFLFVQSSLIFCGTSRLEEIFKSSQETGLPLNEFKKLFRANTSLLEPCRKYQRMIGRKTLGLSRWNALVDYRITFTTGKYCTAKDIVHKADSYSTMNRAYSHSISNSGEDQNASTNTSMCRFGGLQANRSRNSSVETLDEVYECSVKSMKSGDTSDTSVLSLNAMSRPCPNQKQLVLEQLTQDQDEVEVCSGIHSSVETSESHQEVSRGWTTFSPCNFSLSARVHHTQ